MEVSFTPWRSRLNAEIYDRFVREHRIYGWLNERLVTLARVGDAQRILDLACGTGATTLACLPHMPAWSEIVGVDASEDMIAVARANVHDPRARFEVAAASRVDRIGGLFDRVVCNAAFWQFSDAAGVFDALASIVQGGARLVFNVPAEVTVGEPSTVHPFQVALLEEIRSAGGAQMSGASGVVDRDSMRHAAVAAGFRLVSVERESYRGFQGELAELMSIPAMIGQVASGLDSAERERALEGAKRRTDEREPVVVPWLFFTFERDPDR